MVKQKVKAVGHEEKPKKPSSVRKVKVNQEVAADPAEIYSAELEALASKRFQTLEEAKEGFIDTVVSEIGELNQDEREFLRLVIDTDPTLQEKLEELLVNKGIK